MRGEKSLWLRLPDGRMAAYVGYGLAAGDLPVGTEFRAKQQHVCFAGRSAIEGAKVQHFRVTGVEKVRDGGEVNRGGFPRRPKTVYAVEYVAAGAGESAA